MFGKVIFILFTFCTLNIHAKEFSKGKVMEGVFPYILPDQLQIKQQLDKIFENSRAILNSDTLKKAGFSNPKPRKFTRIIVTGHESLPGYIFKIYLDAQRYKSDEEEHVIFLKRINGANAIAKYIEEKGLQHLIKVPKKWMYLIPQKIKPSKDFPTKNFILVEEDMNLLSADANREAWKSDKVTKELLSALFGLLKEIGLRDCAKIDNIPFSEDGKIAFIDTESFGFKVPYKRLKKALNPEMRNYWDSLIH